ncbi:MAG: hypothetical protein NTY11_02590 [Candidatus Parcubacteria bacterium]|nr:hypothetical protein [Candidatus Parcubacteria bacterium]
MKSRRDFGTWWQESIEEYFKFLNIFLGWFIEGLRAADDWWFFHRGIPVFTPIFTAIILNGIFRPLHEHWAWAFAYFFGWAFIVWPLSGVVVAIKQRHTIKVG